MMFSEKFNEWLIAQGKEPVDPEFAKIIDLAFQDTLRDLKEHKDQMVQSGQFLAEVLTGQAGGS